MNVAISHPLERRTTGAISYLEAGDVSAATTIVMLHGIGSNATSFARLMPLIGDQCRVIAWDAPGYGESEALETEWPDADDYAAALCGLLDEVGCDRAVVVGHSLGALMAARFAANFPERVCLLALLSPATGYGAEKGSPLPAAQQARIDELEALGGPEFARRRAPRLVHQSEDRPDVYAAVERAMSEVRPQGYAQAVRLLATGDIFRDVSALVGLPVMVGVGAQDVVAPPQKAKALYAALEEKAAGAARQFDLFSDCGHALPQEQPTQLWDALSGFMAIHHFMGANADVG